MREFGYRQVELIKGSRHKIAWLPERYAKRGRFVRLFDEDGWRIAVTYLWIPEIPTIPHGYFMGGVVSQ